MSPMDRVAFEKIVEEEFVRLPQHIVAKLQNVDFVLEDEPTEEQKDIGREQHADEEWEPCGDPDCLDCANADDLLGLYEGLPLNERGASYGEISWGYSTVPIPDKISLFKGPLERLADGDEAVLREEIYETLLHEIGHHFGFCEEDVLRLEDGRAEKRG